MAGVEDFIRSEVEDWLGYEIIDKVFQKIVETARNDDDVSKDYDNFIEDALLAKQAGCSPLEFMAHEAISDLPDNKAEWVRLFMKERQDEIDFLTNELKTFQNTFNDLLRRLKINQPFGGLCDSKTIELIKARIGKFYRTPDKLRQQMKAEAHILKSELLKSGKSSRAANDIIIFRLENNPIYHKLTAGFTKETWKKFLQLPKKES